MRKIETLLSVTGLALFGFVASKIGWSALIYQLKAARVAIPILLTLSILRLSLQTQSWTLALRAEGVTANFAELVGIRIASQSMGYLSVLGPAVSEPMKVSFLRRNLDASATATLVDTGIYWLTSALVGLAGAISAAIVLTSRQYTLSLLAIGLLFLLSLLLLVRRNPLLTRLLHFRSDRTPVWLKKAAELETHIFSFRTRHPSTVRSMMFADLICQVLVIGESAVVLATLNVPLHIPTLLGIEAAFRVVKMMSGWLPARIGADEGGAAIAFAAFGLVPANGIVLALTRRFRDLLWCVVGVAWLIWRSRPARVRPQELPEGALLTCKQL